ncbi:hypothetical protein COJ96_23820 [Bacillus sp. AFS073361]|uniref:hypothetical protein n=1 Tax=Bacillus sp. AFS073361 TaxID=2033511 RepID=UPI000BF2E558|nr:hypothetical protein [Bacillus sp. AFS073361]PFP23607.1 hypothetical protein COJ96_23820 [Bacillus sp. AFS073361]
MEMVVPISKILHYIKLKLVILREYLIERKYDAVLLQSQDNISWLTCELLYELPFNLQYEKIALLVTMDKVFLITKNPEVLQIMDSDLTGLQLTMIQLSFYGNVEEVVKCIIGSKKTSSDTETSIYQTEILELEELRYSILR